STGPTGSSHRARAAGTAPYGKKNGGKSPRSQAGWGPTGVSHLVRNDFSVASRPLTRRRRAVLRGSGARPTLRERGRRRAAPEPGRRSLVGDGRAGLLELRLDGVGILLLDALEDGLGGLVDERLGLLQTEGGQAAHLLDDGDLRGAGGLEDDVELGLLLLGR